MCKHNEPEIMAYGPNLDVMPIRWLLFGVTGKHCLTRFYRWLKHMCVVTQCNNNHPRCCMNGAHGGAHVLNSQYNELIVQHLKYEFGVCRCCDWVINNLIPSHRIFGHYVIMKRSAFGCVEMYRLCWIFTMTIQWAYLARIDGYIFLNPNIIITVKCCFELICCVHCSQLGWLSLATHRLFGLISWGAHWKKKTKNNANADGTFSAFRSNKYSWIMSKMHWTWSLPSARTKLNR